jgi:asparagine synthase (glutamine-hydrolysing)
MCGIAGILQFHGQPADGSNVALMTKALAHRGPDGEGLIVRGPAALGHRRLSIIDLEGGRQPLSNEDGTVWITFNGEIYNYKELRPQLEAQGHVFRTQSDTEVIVHAYEQWGDDCVSKFRGMFAFAILDERRRRLFLARDQLGIKPLYYRITQECIAFASELQALRVLPGMDWSLDLQALDEYLALQYIPAPRTIYRNVQKLPPAHRLVVEFGGRCPPPEQYWRLEFRANSRRSEADTAAELDEVLRESVRSHLVSDVPFGAFLSGGVDSSVIVAYMAEMLGRPVKTFSIGFEEADFNELEFAREASEICGTEHHEEVVRPDALSILPKLVQHYGEPFGDNSAIPTYYVSRLARQHVPMVLSGDGGDEFFAGYNTYRRWMKLRPTLDPRPLWKRMLRAPAVKLFPTRFRSFPRRDITVSDWQEIVQLVSFDLRKSLWRPELQSSCSKDVPLFEKDYRNAASFPRCARAQYLDIKTYLPNDILTKVDVASMMHGLEARTPIVDIRVAEFAATIPESYNIGRNPAEHWVGKAMLKRIASKWYSSDFLNRKKQGFTMPLSRWFGEAGSMEVALRERLHDPSSPLRDYFEPDGVQAVIQRGFPMPLWVLLFLDEWLRHERGLGNG